jgi:hypothetical protein
MRSAGGRSTRRVRTLLLGDSREAQAVNSTFEILGSQVPHVETVYGGAILWPLPQDLLRCLMGWRHPTQMGVAERLNKQRSNVAGLARRNASSLNLHGRSYHRPNRAAAILMTKSPSDRAPAEKRRGGIPADAQTDTHRHK